MGRVSEKTLRSRQYVVEKMPKDRQMAFRREILAIREHEQAAEREATAGGNVAASGTEAAALFRKEQERLVALNRELEDLEKHRERLVERLNKLNNVGQTAQPEKKTTADPYRCDHPANHALSTPTVSPDGTAATNSYAPVIERTTLPERSTSVPPPSDQRSAQALSSPAAPFGDGAESKGCANTSASGEASGY